MFDSFLVALNAIMPTFLLLAFGYFLKHKNFVSSEFLKQTNTLTFKFFLPFLLFNNIYKTEITEAIDGMTFTIAVGSLLLLFAVLCVVVPRVVREPKQRGVIIQGLFRSNYVIFGVSLVTNVFGAEEAAAASILSAVLVPMYNVLAVIALTVFTGGGKVSLKKTLKSIATNPLIIAALLGVFASIIKLRFPAFLETSLRDVSRLATPLALIVLLPQAKRQHAYCGRDGVYKARRHSACFSADRGSGGQQRAESSGACTCVGNAGRGIKLHHGAAGGRRWRTCRSACCFERCVLHPDCIFDDLYFAEHGVAVKVKTRFR